MTASNMHFQIRKVKGGGDLVSHHRGVTSSATRFSIGNDPPIQILVANNIVDR